MTGDSYTTPNSPQWSPSSSSSRSTTFGTPSVSTDKRSYDSNLTPQWRDASDSASDLSDGTQYAEEQGSFFNVGAVADEDMDASMESYWTTIDPNDDEAVDELAEAYPKEELLDIFKSLGDELPNMLYPGKGVTYRLALSRVTRMTNKTLVQRLAQLGYNFDTNQFP